MKIVVISITAVLFAACGPSLKEKAEESTVVKESVVSQAYLDSMDRVTAIKDSIYFSGPTVNIVTTKGTMSFKLYNKTPLHRDNFIKLAQSNYYNWHTFHSIVKDFMIQTEDFTNKNGTGGQSWFGTPIKNEIDRNLTHSRGIVSMANAGPGTNGSQFFITTIKTAWLDGAHVVFGKITEGMDLVQKIEATQTNFRDKPTLDVRIADCGAV